MVKILFISLVFIEIILLLIGNNIENVTDYIKLIVLFIARVLP